MIKFSYDKVSDAFQDYNGYCEDGLKQLPKEVWDALDNYCDELEIEADSLSNFFDNLYINDLFTDDVSKVNDDNVTVLYVDDNNKAYCLQ